MGEEKKSWWRGAVDKIEGQVEKQKRQTAENEAQAGSLVIEKQFGTSTIAIYDGGYVRVSKVLNTMTPLTPYEQLKSITYREQVQDRSAVGSALYKTPFDSKEKRTISLTIATDRKVHTLSTEKDWSNRADKSGMALEAAGRAVLDALGAAAPVAPPPAPAAPQPDAADQLKKLAELHAAGIVTDEEFAAKKAELLKRL
ncbi:SHOCT domain-containing protein [Nocardioides taihuensis]|uniref:SHOCT domain-containing protein n=1 Tax=Nocardioides taihuensis TaxID=1835606 RepID=A0ABW0BPS2_9ACTN